MSLIFPIADLRGFVPDTGRLARPVWPNPAGSDDFIRYFGMRRVRMFEGLEDWVGEDMHIDARRGIRFGASSDPASPIALPSPFISAYRRLFFDGMATAKIEIGLTDDQITRKIDHSKDLEPGPAPSYSDIWPAEPAKYRDVYVLEDMVRRHLDVAVRIASPSDKSVKIGTLGSAAPHLTRLYANATLEHKRMLTGLSGKWWVQSGQPLVIVAADRRDTWLRLPTEAKTLSSPNPEAPELHQYSLRFAGGLRRVWILSYDAFSDSDYTRRLRIHLARLHAEHECLRLILNSLGANHLAIKAGTPQSAALEMYFEHVFDHIARTEALQAGELGSDPAAWARESTKAVTPADVKAIRGVARKLGFSRSVQAKIARYAGDLATTDDAAGFARQSVIERRNVLRDAMVRDFDVSELDDLCAQLGITEEFIVDRKTAYVNALIGHVDREGLLEQLTQACQAKRPDRSEYM